MNHYEKAESILLVDDEADSGFLISHLMQKAEMMADLQCVARADEAINVLRSCAENGPACLPVLVLVDLDVTTTESDEVIRRIREAPESRGLIVVALIPTPHEFYLERVRASGAHSHLVKYPKPATLRALYDFACGPTRMHRAEHCRSSHARNRRGGKKHGSASGGAAQPFLSSEEGGEGAEGASGDNLRGRRRCSRRRR
jgi:CheY-like chemotaxis protein